MRTHNANGPEFVSKGTVWLQVVVVRIRWRWITAHIALIILSLLLLTGTIVNQYKSSLTCDTWKSSSLVVLHALDSRLQQDLNGISTHSELAALDQAQRVRLGRTNAGRWGLLTQDKSGIALQDL